MPSSCSERLRSPSSPHPRLRRAVARGLLVAFAAGLPGSPPARAEVAGEQVVAGEASIERNGAITTIHASDGAIIEYDAFSVWAHEQLHFVQPHSQARVLNRVFGEATHIDGGLYANGIVYIVNPAGIFFGAGAIVDVGGLYAAAGNLTNEDFAAGVDRFELSGIVENAGAIESPSVALLGRAVANHGQIHAPEGTIVLVAGQQVLLTRLGGHLHVEVEGVAGDEGRPAIEQTGNVDAGAGEVSFTTGDVYSLALNHEGITRGREIELRAASGLVQVSGRLDASDPSEGASGGEIAVTGGKVALQGALLDASGDAGGGRIRVGGDLRGRGALPNAKRVFVDEDTALRADALSSGDGGTVIVYADEATAFHGAVSARGGASGGDGGFAEISGAVFLWSGGDVDLRAVRGADGTLLYDPKDIVIAGGAADGDDAPDAGPDLLEMSSPGSVLFGDPDELASPFTIFESEIEGTQANIVLEATNSITAEPAASFTNEVAGEGVGVLRIQDGRSLTLRTRNDPGDSDGSATMPGVDLGDLAIDTSGADDASGSGGVGGAVVITTGDGSIRVGSIDTRGGDATSADPTHAGGDAGAISLLAGDADASGDSDVTVSGDLVALGGDASGAGAGGRGGNVTVRSDGVAVAHGIPNGIPATLVEGGGDLALADVVARGGDGGAAGGRGGNVDLRSSDGTITAGDLDSSGGAGGTSGGSAGSLTALTRDADRMNDNDVDLGNLVATGGTGTGGAGGQGGNVNVQTQRSQQVQELGMLDNILREPEGGGDVTIASLDASGGDGGTSGGRGGSAFVVARGEANPLQVGAVTTRGGAGGSVDTSAGGSNDGGSAGAITLQVEDADLVIAVLLDASGGGAGDDGTGDDDALGGNGGAVDLDAGFGEDPSGSIVLEANVVAREGAHGVDAEANRPTEIRFRDGGDVSLTAADHVEHAGQAGPHVSTTGDVALTAGGDIGQINGALVVEGSDERRSDGLGSIFDHDALLVSAGGSADVQVADGGRFLRQLTVEATDLGADIVVAQPGEAPMTGDRIEMAGNGSEMVLLRADGTGNGVDLSVVFVNPDEEAADAPLVLAADSVTAGGFFRADSDGDIVVGDASSTVGGNVVTAGALPDPDAMGEPVVASPVVLFADNDRDGDGALRDAPGGAVGVIDMLGAADEAGILALQAGEGIGDPDGAITIRGGADVAATNRPRVLDEGDPMVDGDETIVPDPLASSGIQLRNVGSGDLAIVRLSPDLPGLVVDAGSGDIEVTNEGGDVVVESVVSTRPADEADGTGGDVTLTVTDPAARIVFDTASSAGILSGGGQTWDGDVVLARDFFFVADGGVDVLGTIDTDDTAASEAGLGGLVDGSSTFAGDIGAARALSSLELRAVDEDATPDVTLDLASVTTTVAQRYEMDLAVTGNPQLSSGNLVSFGGEVAAAAGGLGVAAPAILFSAEGDQTVTAGADGIRLNADAAPDPANLGASIGKIQGDLRLETTGALRIGDGHKLSVPGRLDLIGDTVRFTDLSAIDIVVEAPSGSEVFARAPGAVRLSNGSVVIDGGTDILANSVSFDSTPTVVGSGPTPRLATLGGSVQNAGSLQTVPLPAPITAADISTAAEILDLAIPTADPGLETPELFGGSVEVPAALYPSEDAAAPGAVLSPAEVVAFLACAPVDGEATAGCAPTARPPYGSALDTERAGEIARAWRELLGDSRRARAGREALARAAADPDAVLGGAGTSPAGRAYLQETARLLARTRMLGLGGSYGEVRRDLLEALVDAIGAPQLDAGGLLAAVEPYAMGMPL